jgi:hypothetical protein
MIVKIDLNSFRGCADLSGTEVETLTKILGKFFGTDERYLESKYVQVRTDEKVAPDVRILVDTEFMSGMAYDTAKKAQDAREAAEREAIRQECAIFVKQFAAKIDDGALDNADRTEMDALFGAKHSFLYWGERLVGGATHTAFYTHPDGVSFLAGLPSKSPKRITLGFDGSFKREEI